MGRNGSGKSTVLKALLGQLPFEGQIQFLPKPQSVAWLPQQFHVSVRIPVLDFIALGTGMSEGIFPKRNSHAILLAKAALVELGMPHLGDKQTDELSGGEWQMVCLAQLVVQPTHVWLLDEPTAFLDIYHKNLVFNFLWRKAKGGKLILLSTHDLPFLPTEGGSYLYLTKSKADTGVLSTESVSHLMADLGTPEANFRP